MKQLKVIFYPHYEIFVFNSNSMILYEIKQYIKLKFYFFILLK